MLCLLATTIPEILSTSTPPIAFLVSPVSGLALVVFYGSGSLLVREAAFRWRKGWVATALLGAAYSVVEEGLQARTWYTSSRVVTVLHLHGRVLGINWMWAADLTVIEMTLAVCIPIALVHVAFPTERSRSWVGNKGLAVVAVLFLLSGKVGMSTIGRHAQVRPLSYFLAICICAGFVVLARLVPASPWREAAGTGGRGIRIWAIGAAGMFLVTVGIALVVPGVRLVSFFAFGIGVFDPGSAGAALVSMVLVLATPPLVGAIWLRMAMQRPWSDGEVLAACGGLLAVFLVAAPLHELHPPPGRNEIGLTTFALAMVLLLLLLARRTTGRISRSAGG